MFGRGFPVGRLWFFRPVGRPRRLGKFRPRRRALASVMNYGPSRSVTLFVGQNKGKEDKNRSGVCARKPEAFSLRAVDQALVELRSEQVGKEFVSATRVAGRGFYKGDAEDSLAYEVAYIPPAGGGSPSEPTFQAFSKNMNRLAERIAERFCQDEVLIVRDDGDKRTVAGAVWER